MHVLKRAAGLMLALIGALAVLAAPAEAQEGCFTVGGGGIGACYGISENGTTVFDGGTVSTPPACLGPLGCQPATPVATIPAITAPSIDYVCVARNNACV